MVVLLDPLTDARRECAEVALQASSVTRLHGMFSGGQGEWPGLARKQPKRRELSPLRSWLHVVCPLPVVLASHHTTSHHISQGLKGIRARRREGGRAAAAAASEALEGPRQVSRTLAPKSGVFVALR